MERGKRERERGGERERERESWEGEGEERKKKVVEVGFFFFFRVCVFRILFEIYFSCPFPSFFPYQLYPASCGARAF